MGSIAWQRSDSRGAVASGRCSRSRRRALQTSTVFGTGFLVVASLLLAPLAQAAPPAGCTVAGEAFGAQITAAGVLNLAKVADVVLPGAPATVANATVTGVLTSGNVTDSSTDVSTPTQASATSTSNVQNVAILGAAVTADSVTAVATSVSNGASASSSPAGTTFANLRINGVAQGAVAANTTVPLPGIGSVIINEQVPSGNGTTTSGLLVNALHVRVTTAGILPAGSEVIIASALSNAACSVPLVPAAAAPPNTPTSSGGGGGGGGGSSNPKPAPTAVLTAAEATAAAQMTATARAGAGGAATAIATSTAVPASAPAAAADAPTPVPNAVDANATATSVARAAAPAATVGPPVANGGPNLVVNISPPPPFKAGGTGSIDIAVQNQGPASAPGPITVSDTLPPGFTYQGATGDGSSCSASGQIVTCTHAGPLAAGAGFGISLQVAVDSSAAPLSTDLATASDAKGSPVANAEAPLVVAGAAGTPELTVNVEPPGPFTADGNGSIRITVTNVGTAADPGPQTVTDVLPAGFKFLGSTGGGWMCSASGQTVTCMRNGSLAVNESSQFSLQVAVDVSALTAINRLAVSPPAGGRGGRMQFPLVVAGVQIRGSGSPATAAVESAAPDVSPEAQVPATPARLPNTGSAEVDSNSAFGAAGLFGTLLVTLGFILRSRAQQTSRRKEPSRTA